mmetsp:Transcript_4198/g.5469  ORF Transcript_4198/g.5469 Transcript_4198/m.5469 type:complete len:522 (+) Transcript_4198:106-1671(+)
MSNDRIEEKVVNNSDINDDDDSMNFEIENDRSGGTKDEHNSDMNDSEKSMIFGDENNIEVTMSSVDDLMVKSDDVQQNDNENLSSLVLQKDINLLKETAIAKDGKMKQQEQLIQSLATALRSVEGDIEEMKKTVESEKEDQQSSSQVIITQSSSLVSSSSETQSTHKRNRFNLKALLQVESFSNDTFTLMMFNKTLSKSWILGLVIFVCEQTLLATILHDALFTSATAHYPTLNAPIRGEGPVRVAQFICFFLVIATQRDICESFTNLMTFKNRSSIQWNFGEDGKAVSDTDESEGLVGSFNRWVFQLLLPNICKFIVGCITYFLAFVLIIQSTNALDLFMKVVAVLLIAEMDRIAFIFASRGYFGPNIHQDTEMVKNTNVESPMSMVLWERLAIGVPIVLLIIGWFGIMIGQDNGIFFYMKYPNCNIDKGEIKHAGNGVCDGLLNSMECDFDMGDCVNFNIAYPDCDVQFPFLIGNDKCDGMFYNTHECGYDGMDCYIASYPKCYVDSPEKVGDGVCNNV